MVNYRQIIVDGFPVALRGLDEIFAALHKAERKPGDVGIGQQIVTELSRENYIPRSAQDVFVKALEQEYTRYIERRQDGSSRKRGYAMWRGYPRTSIPWFPTVNEDLCDGCGACLQLCRNKALGPTTEGKTEVVDPFACIVGCSSCATICKSQAITFPPKSVLDVFKFIS